MSQTEHKITFGIIGGGWRAEFYLRIAQALPSRFEVAGMVVRDAEKGERIESMFGVRTYRSLDKMLEASDPSFIVLSVPWAACPGYIAELSERGVPVLSETPPAPDLSGLIELQKFTDAGAKIQVAEQYPFQPRNQAILDIVRSGKLGEISHAQVSLAHGYHGIALLRKCLGVGFDEVRITAKRFGSRITAGPDRGGEPQREELIPTHQDIAWFEFPDKHGVFDFTRDQYFSWIRSPRVLIRGTRGEIHNDTVRYLHNFHTPVQTELRRMNAGENGNLEGYYLKGILLGEAWVYSNEFVPARLTDDELAIATCLRKMHDYVNGGESFYSLAEASHDHYLNLLLGKALESGMTVTSERQPWME
ncbi:Gfo/Idh/MocA family oxidoreductase [Paenibacillus sp. GD4]|uniref:Gfo/Idh/MocA family protein n=1 Tax=Paenibacillus sp. GD4 TaxID=3068890 RepID=UPI002796CD79|nr:Gfo/Idh/MocA family oxidoreductase [Paenibacillus sp. GD4]MDQ1913946.1 Gfo/Idh/MocA family oxidoreductase [Paenibacillus sp. GD4]